MDPLKGSVLKVFITYAFPTVLGMLAMSSAGVIDGIFVGNYVGSDALAAVNICLPLLAIMMGVALMFSVGGSVTIGKFLGAGDELQASSVYSHVLLTLIVVAVSIAGLSLLFVDELTLLLGSNEALMSITEEYLWVILLFLPVFMVSVFLMYLVRIDGRPVLAGSSFVISAGANIALDWYLIAQLDMGISGAAWATALSWVVGLMVLLPYFFTGKRRLRFALQAGGMGHVGRAAINGSSDFANESSAGITALFFNWIMMSRFGVDGVAAFAVVNYILFMGLIVCFAVSDAVQPLISQCYGAGDSKRIESFLKVALLFIAGIGLMIIALLVSAPDTMVGMFLEESAADTAQIATQFIYFFWPAFLFNGANICLAAYCTAMHKPVPSALIALSRSLVLPVMLVFTLPTLVGDNGVFMAIPVAELLTLAFAIYIFKRNSPAGLMA